MITKYEIIETKPEIYSIKIHHKLLIFKWTSWINDMYGLPEMFIMLWDAEKYIQELMESNNHKVRSVRTYEIE